MSHLLDLLSCHSISSTFDLLWNYIIPNGDELLANVFNATAVVLLRLRSRPALSWLLAHMTSMSIGAVNMQVHSLSMK